MTARRLTRIASTSVCALAAVLLAAASALALPPGRHYEMVSPPYKAGYSAPRFEAAAMTGSQEGERVVFESQGSFAGNPDPGLLNWYLAQRTATGWQTSPLGVPAPLSPAGGGPVEIRPDLEAALTESALPGANVSTEFGSETEFLYHSFSLPDLAPNAAEPDPLFPTMPNPAPYYQIAGEPLKWLEGQPRSMSAFLPGASANLCVVLITLKESGRLVPEATGISEHDLYEMATGLPGCAAERALRMVGVSNRLGPHREPMPISAYCLVEPGSLRPAYSSGAISADGAEVFFTTQPVHEGKECSEPFTEHYYPDNPLVLYVRLAGQRTLQIAKPLAQMCEVGELCPGQQPAEFVGASEDGSRVFFTTVQPLVSGDAEFTCRETSREYGFETQAACESATGQEHEQGKWHRFGNDLYMATIGCPPAKPSCAPAEREVTAMTQVSHDPHAGEAAEVQGVMAVSSDGSRVYFVARGVLSTEGPKGEGVQGSPVAGADNLYVYDAQDGSVRFVADLCSGSRLSGEASDARCPIGLEPEQGKNSGQRNDSMLWYLPKGEAQLADPSGRFLVFSTYARLTRNDTDSGRDVYRYDAQSGQIVRVSVGEAGEDANGNGAGYDALIPPPESVGNRPQSEHEANTRAISEDGSRIVFETNEPLSAAATNGLVNAYEWHEGAVSLVSTGSETENGIWDGQFAKKVAITPSGRDIFFLTSAPLVAQDTDVTLDVYDARLGSGFPQPPAKPARCKGDACQGPLTNPAPLLVPGSVSQAPGENLAAESKKACKRKPRCKHGRRRPHRGRACRRTHRRRCARRDRRARPHGPRRHAHHHNHGGRK